MTTLSTLTLQPPSPPKPPILPVKDIWDKYFAGNHQDVINDANHALFGGTAPDYLHVMGLGLLGQKRLQEALPVLRAALLLYPNAASWFANSAIAALNAGSPQDSLDFALAGLARHSQDAVLHFAHGNALMHLNQLNEAIEPFVRALTINPQLHDAKLNLGNVLRRLGRSEEALSLYNQVVNVEPNNGVALINRAGALIELNKHDESAMVLLRLMAISDIPEVNFMMAMLRLMEGDFKNGFDLYRSRFDCAMAIADKAQFHKPLIQSLAEAAGAHVLISHEQGFGDSLQFIRYLPMMVSNARKVTLLVPQTLHRLFAPLDDQVTLVTDRAEAGNYDLECPILHMPFLFETSLDTIPAKIPYLTVPPDMIAAHPLPDRAPGTHKRVGLVWAGQMRPNPDLAAVDRRRSLSYGQFETFLDVDSVDFISLQLGDPVAQMMSQSTKGKRRPHEVLDNSMDFLDTAAIIMQLDLVITVDTAVAHLAAALGKPVWVLSRFDSCWRWLRDRTDSPWYPGVLRLFHQETRGDWSATLAEVKCALASWAQN